MNALFIRFRYYSDFHYMKSITGEWSLEKMRYERIRLALSDLNSHQMIRILMPFKQHMMRPYKLFHSHQRSVQC